MPIGLIGRKVGMTRKFTDAGVSVPITVVHAPANRVTQVKTPDGDGYLALQLAARECKPSRANKAMTGHFRKAGVGAMRSLREFRVAEEELRNPGDRVGVTSFSAGEKVNVVGVSKGKGFSGVIKRHNFKSQDATHGNSLSHRSAGSIGQCQTPGKVFKGKKMAGQMGNKRVTVRNLTVFEVDEARELLLLRGSLPGSPGSEVLVHHLVAVPPEEPPAEEEASPETPAEESAGTSTGASAGAQAEASSEASAEESAEENAEAEETSSEASAEESADASTGAQAEASPEASAEESTGAQAEASPETPAEESAEAQAEASSEASAKESADASTGAQAEASPETPAEESADASTGAKAEASPETPAEESADASTGAKAEVAVAGQDAAPDDEGPSICRFFWICRRGRRSGRRTRR